MPSRFRNHLSYHIRQGRKVRYNSDLALRADSIPDKKSALFTLIYFSIPRMLLTRMTGRCEKTNVTDPFLVYKLISVTFKQTFRHTIMTRTHIMS